MQPAEARTDAFREQWVRRYALTLVWAGAIVEGIVFSVNRDPWNGPDLVHASVWLGLALLVAFRVRVELLVRYLVLGTLVASSGALWGAGFLGPTGPLLGLAPIAAAVLLGTRWAVGATVGAVLLVLGAAYAHGTGLIVGGRFTVAQSSSWWIAGAALLLVAASAVTLVSQLLRDLERVSGEFEEARKGLVIAGELRVAAENARDAALRLRNENRSVEALGVVAGSVVHDLRNMAQVIRTWADEVARTEADGGATDASASIVEACDRLNHLAADVLTLGQTPASADPELSLAESLPKAARALRRFLREDIRIVVDSDVPRGLPLLPITNVDLVHLVLEAAAAMNVTAIGSGTLIVSAPRAAAAEGPPSLPGTHRYPALLSFEIQRDENVKSTREWLRTEANLAEGVELAHIPGARVVLWCPAKDTALIAFDVYEEPVSSHGRIPLFGRLEA